MPENFLAAMGPMADPYGAFQQGAANQIAMNRQQQAQQVSAFNLQQAQQASQAQQLANAQAEEHSRDWQAALQDFMQSPSAQKASNLSLQFPENSKQVKDAWDMRDKDVQRSDLNSLGVVYSAINNKRPDIAQAHLEERLSADKAAGKSEPMVQAMLDAIKADPKQASGMALAAIALVDGGNDFLKTLGKGQKTNHVINEGGSLVDDNGAVLFHSPSTPKYGKVKDEYGVEHFVREDGGGTPTNPSGGITSGKFTGGWTPRAKNGGDNSDNVVDSMIRGAANFLGLGPQDDISGVSPMKIAQAMTLSEGGAGSPADRNNNPANIKNTDGTFKVFATKDAGLAAAAALVARKLKNGQTTVQSMIEGLPSRNSGSQQAPKGDGPFGINADLRGDDAIAAIPQRFRPRVQQLLDGRSLLTAREKASPLGQQLFDAANQADPTYSESVAPVRFKTAKDYAPGGIVGKQLTAARTVVDHLYDLASASDKLGGGSWRFANSAMNYGKRQMNDSALITYHNILTNLATELPSFLKLAGAATIPEEASVKDDLDPDLGNEGRKTAIATKIGLIAGKVKPLTDAFNDAMGTQKGEWALMPHEQQVKLAAIESWLNGGHLSGGSAQLKGQASSGRAVTGMQPPVISHAAPVSIPQGARAVNGPNGKKGYVLNGKFVAL